MITRVPSGDNRRTARRETAAAAVPNGKQRDMIPRAIN